MAGARLRVCQCGPVSPLNGHAEGPYVRRNPLGGEARTARQSPESGVAKASHKSSARSKSRGRRATQSKDEGLISVKVTVRLPSLGSLGNVTLITAGSTGGNSVPFETARGSKLQPTP